MHEVGAVQGHLQPHWQVDPWTAYCIRPLLASMTRRLNGPKQCSLRALLALAKARPNEWHTLSRGFDGTPHTIHAPLSLHEELRHNYKIPRAVRDCPLIPTGLRQCPPASQHLTLGVKKVVAAEGVGGCTAGLAFFFYGHYVSLPLERVCNRE